MLPLQNLIPVLKSVILTAEMVKHSRQAAKYYRSAKFQEEVRNNIKKVA